VWSALLLGAASSPFVGRDAATLGSYALATALVLATGTPTGLRAHGWGRKVGLGVLVGVTSWPGWLLVLGAAFETLGLSSPTGSLALGAAGWAASIVLAPVFEELLYRERLLAALEARIGPLLAIALTSVLFALPHVELHAIVATTHVGLLLGAVRVALGSVVPCVGLHAGLNVGAWLSAAPWAHASS
jgi:membrane protease YdiL (CAAX protease family)